MIKNCDMTAAGLPGVEEILNKPEDVCPVQWAAAVAHQAHQSTCGHDVFCRDGLNQLYLIMEEITNDRGTTEDLDLLAELCDTMLTGAGCELSYKAVELVKASLDNYGEEWRAHIVRKKCSAFQCKPFYSLYIDPNACTGCGACRKHAPEGAVAGGEGLIHVIKNDSALTNEEFLGCCPVSAIKKAGTVKPALPPEPVPVGTFGAGGAAGGRRRRRG